MDNLKIEAAVKKCSHVFKNGVCVVNTTPHPITFEDEDGSLVTIASDPILIINAGTEVRNIDEFDVTTAFVPKREGLELIEAIKKSTEAASVVKIIGSVIAMGAYPGKVHGMIPVPGYERVAPAEKRMSCKKFNVCTR